MKTRRIGSLEVSVVGFGANNFTDFFGNKCSQEDATRIVDAALDVGINFIDTAEEYSTRTPWGMGYSEEFLGVALRSRRNDIVLASKFMPRIVDDPAERGATRIVNAVEGSLRRLRTDRIDLYQQHRPDPDVPIDEILEALDRLVRDGKVVEIGCSSFTGEMMAQAAGVSDARGLCRFASLQAEFNLLDRPAQAGALETCARGDIALLPFFPLASGLLTGKYRKGAPPPAGSRFEAQSAVTDYLRDRQLSDDRIATVERLDAFAQERGHTILELAFSWLLAHPFVASVIAGANRPDQIRANAAAACWDLTAEDMAAVDAILGR